eukprot:364917-Chlamydomonas_euryale.AAC.6
MCTWRDGSQRSEGDESLYLWFEEVAEGRDVPSGRGVEKAQARVSCQGPRTWSKGEPLDAVHGMSVGSAGRPERIFSMFRSWFRALRCQLRPPLPSSLMLPLHGLPLAARRPFV